MSPAVMRESLNCNRKAMALAACGGLSDLMVDRCSLAPSPLLALMRRMGWARSRSLSRWNQSSLHHSMRSES